MTIRTLATDYDGTIATHGTVDPDTLHALRRLRDGGGTLILVTGRELPQLKPVSVGRVIVATYEPHETTVLQVIRELGLERQVIFNKGAVMVLPSGVNKATGLKCALEELKLDAANVVGVGDAENDHALLQLCGLGAAVQNALPALK